MAAFVVIDSGVLISSVLKETLTTKAKAILRRFRDEAVQLVAPTIFRYEVVAVIRKAVYQTRLTVDEGLTARDFLLEYPVQPYIDDALLKRAYELATQFNRPTAYDSQYLALAERLKCDFWTADEKLFNAVQGTLTWIKWLGNYAIDNF